MNFTEEKPTTVGQYTWRLPEAEKDGTYDLRVVVTKAIGGGLLITTEEGDDICRAADAKDGVWAQGWGPMHCRNHQSAGCDPDATATRYDVYDGDRFLHATYLCAKCRAALLASGHDVIVHDPVSHSNGAAVAAPSQIGAQENGSLNCPSASQPGGEDGAIDHIAKVLALMIGDCVEAHMEDDEAHAVGDVEDVVRAAISEMEPRQVARFIQSDPVKSLVEFYAGAEQQGMYESAAKMITSLQEGKLG